MNKVVLLDDDYKLLNKERIKGETWSKLILRLADDRKGRQKIRRVNFFNINKKDEEHLKDISLYLEDHKQHEKRI